MKTTFLKNTIAAAALVGAGAMLTGNAFAEASYANVVPNGVIAPQTQMAPQSGTTRAAVKADLARVEAAGYQPGTSNLYYPQNLQAAENRVQSQQNGNQTAANYQSYPSTQSSYN